MNLSLGNMFGERMAINPDGLSLDLAFAADKTLTARKGPTPTFTRASTATFVGSNGLIQSAAINEARFDHDSVSLDCKGLLIEEARTNSNTRSQEFDNVAYGKASTGVAAATITANNDTAPDGTLTADLVNFSATTAINQQGMLFRTVFTATIGQIVTLSVFMRVPSGTATVFIALSEGGVVTGQSVACNVTTTWQRFSVTRTALAAVQIFIELGPDTRSVMGQPAVQPAASVLLWGAQFEVGAFPTSYIPTTTAPLLRSADVCSITGGDFTSFYNQSEGTVVIQSQTTTLNSNIHVISISDGGTNNLIVPRYSSPTNSSTVINTLGVNQLGVNITIPSGGVLRYALALKLNDAAISVNGASPVLDATITLPAVDRAFIGTQIGSTSNTNINGHIARLQYFRKRLPNAKLQTLTT